MKIRLPFLVLALASLGLSACDRSPGGGRTKSSPSSDSKGGAAEAGAKAVAGATSGGASVVGPASVSAWDALSAEAKAKVKVTTALYIHQSVGQDLEDGAEAIGFKFEYYGKDSATVAPGLNGGLFNDVGPIDNGKPMEKLALIEKLAKKHSGKLSVLMFSFGYADVRDEDLDKVQAEYVRVAKEVKSSGARMVHVTPPLVFDVSENAPKMKMRTWMLSTFSGEPIFDLQDLESLDNGKRCEVGGVWRICQANRSTNECPSKGQGVDSDGQGHLCSTKAADFAKALLYTLSRAGG